MAVELNQATFRRLVQLYFLSAVVSSVVALYSARSPKWRSFDEDFAELSVRHFGERTTSEWIDWAGIALGILFGAWMLLSILGLLRFKRWARTGHWASIVGLFATSLAIVDTGPSTTTLLDDALSLVDSALFGAILLLAYANRYGDEWFAPPPRD